MKMSLVRVCLTYALCFFIFQDVRLVSCYGVDLSGRITIPTCVPIPSNMGLCKNIGYNQMRMPNLLEHDSLDEVKQQAASWVPLLTQRCHPSTQIFLCSLFAPVCLDRPIYPCRSLCESVKEKCSPIMMTNGYPWPEMLRCTKLPLDNDLCITVGMTNSTEKGKPTEEEGVEIIDEGEGLPDIGGGDSKDGVCSECHQEATEEKIMEEFCNADFVVKTKISEGKKAKANLKFTAKGKKKKFYKRGELKKKDTAKMTLYLDGGASCNCDVLSENKNTYLIMGKKVDKKLHFTFVMPWLKSRDFRRTTRQFRNPSC
ncbi:secreted frizzled-related protein 5-like isoform X2 [Glandiceps talaboti]